MFELVQQFGRGRTGIVRLLVAKDRPGALRQHAAAGREIARLILVSRPDQLVDVELQVPGPDAAGADHRPAWQPTALMEKLSRFLEEAASPISQNGVERAGLGRKAQYVRLALQQLVDEGHVAANIGPRNAKLYRSLTPFRAPADPGPRTPP